MLILELLNVQVWFPESQALLIQRQNPLFGILLSSIFYAFFPLLRLLNFALFALRKITEPNMKKLQILGFIMMLIAQNAIQAQHLLPYFFNRCPHHVVYNYLTK